MNDDKFIRDLEAAQALDEAINRLQADPTASDDDLAALIGLVQGIEPPADFVAQLDRRLQARHERMHRPAPRRNYYWQSGLVAAAILLCVVGVVGIMNEINQVFDEVTSNLANDSGMNQSSNNATQRPSTRTVATQVAIFPTATPIQTLIAELATQTPQPSSTPTPTPTATPMATDAPTEAMALTVTPTMQMAATQLPQPTSAPTQMLEQTSVALASPTHIPMTATIEIKATSMANFTRIIDDNAAWEVYLAYRETMPDALGLPVEERHLIRIENTDGQPLAGRPVRINDSEGNFIVLLRTNIDGVVYFFPQVYTDTALSFSVEAAGQTRTITRIPDTQTTFVMDATPPTQLLSVMLWVTEPNLIPLAEAIEVEGATIEVVQSLDFSQPLPDVIFLVDDTTPTLPTDYPDFLLQLSGVKMHTLAGASLDPQSEYALRQIAQFTGGIFIAYDPPGSLTNQIIYRIEQELENVENE